jgi:hypothetical protein
MAHGYQRSLRALVVVALTSMCQRVAVAHEDAAELQKKLTNPVSDIVSLPFQWTTNLNVGPLDEPQHVLNIQPVYPVKLSDKWSLINRAIIPIVSNPAFASDQDRVSGLGDILLQEFFAPAPKHGGLIWGIGPAIQLDTATGERLGTGKWAAGPTVVFLGEPGDLTVGALLTQVFSFAGDADRTDVSLFQLQPILSYRLNPKLSVAYVGIITADWEAEDSSQAWTVPLGASLSRVTRPKGFVPVNYIAGAGYNVVRPDQAGDWFLRAQVIFILPK